MGTIALGINSKESYKKYKLMEIKLLNNKWVMEERSHEGKQKKFIESNKNSDPTY